MTEEPRPSAGDEPDGISREALDAAMANVPVGALALAGITVSLLILAYLLIYFLVFLPRGPVG